jgi:hypothetical protein
LSNIAVWSGILGSFGMPVVGAIVDHTPYRKQVAFCSAVLLALTKSLEVIVGSHATASYAYTSELMSDHNQQTKYNLDYNVILYMSMLTFLILVLGSSNLFLKTTTTANDNDNDDHENNNNDNNNDDHEATVNFDVQTAQISQVVTSTVALACFVFAWTFVSTIDRPPRVLYLPITIIIVIYACQVLPKYTIPINA